MIGAQLETSVGRLTSGNPKLMRDALRGIDGLAAAHADQKSGCIGAISALSLSMAACVHAPPKGRAQSICMALDSSPRLERRKPFFHRGAAADEGETRRDPRKARGHVVYAAAETEARQG